MKLVAPAGIAHGVRNSGTRRLLVLAILARALRFEEVAADEFCRTYRERSARIAFFAALRNIYLDPPHGKRGLWTRLADLRPPALFVWGDKDKLVPASFSRHVAEALPSAENATTARSFLPGRSRVSKIRP